MAVGKINESTLQNIGEAIRAKNGQGTTYLPSQMAQAILNLPTSTPTGTVSISANGSYNVASKKTAVVNVPNSFTAADNGKVVSGGNLVVQGSISVSSNGTYNTTSKKQVVVSIPKAVTSLSTASNGVFNPPANYDGFSRVVVNVPTFSSTDNGKVLSGGRFYGQGSSTFRSNGTYNTSLIKSVKVDVQPSLKSLVVSSNSVYKPPTGYDGFSRVVVNVPAESVTPVTASISISENGTYFPASGVDGFSKVVVSVPTSSVAPAVESITVSENGVYTPSEGVDGYSEVTVDVQPSLDTLSVFVNGSYTPASGFDGFGEVVVDVPTGTDDSDATLASGGQMLSGVTAYASGSKYTGTIETYSGVVNSSASIAGYPVFSGEYFVQPSTSEQVLSTFGHAMNGDVHILPYAAGPVSAVLSDIMVTSNGTYSASTAGVDGFATVVVDIPTPEPSAPDLSEIEILSNGTYYASDTQVDGFSVITVDVPQTSLISSAFYGNGTYDADSGYAFSQVVVDVPALSIGTLSVSSNGTYGIGQYDAYSEVTVSVPTPSMSLLEISSNGVFLPSEMSVDGFSKVIVDVPTVSASMMHKVISASGVYYASDDDVDGYSQVTVAVTPREPVLSSLTVSSNGSYSPASGYDGFGEVVVDVKPPAGYNYSYIAEGAFQSDASLVMADFPMVSTIGSSAFEGCTSLATASFGRCEQIASGAFEGCTSLMSLYLLGSSVCSLGGSLATSLASGFTVYVPSSLYSGYASAWSGYSIASM